MKELAVFVKYWEPGRVKTRLAEGIGPVAASQIYEQFIVTLMSRFSEACDRRVLVFTPEERESEFADLVSGSSWDLSIQSSGELGQRMSRMFQQRFDLGAQAVVLIGSDSPTIPQAYVMQAIEGLERHDVVLGPTADGGYYLMGLRRSMPGLFERIDWSTDRVWDQTLQRVRDINAADSVLILPEWYDVDTLADLDRLCADVASEAEQGLYARLTVVAEICRVWGDILAEP